MDNATHTVTPPDTATEDAARIEATARDFLTPADSFEIPGPFVATHEKLPSGVMWGIVGDRYIYRPMRAWDQGQVFADSIIAQTRGQIFVFISQVMQDLRDVSMLSRDEDESDKDFVLVQLQTLNSLVRQRMSELLGKAHIDLGALAKRAIVECDVRRIPRPEQASKPDSDKSKDHGGPIFSATEAGHVDVYYRGRRDHVVRVGMAAIWGSVGDFFVGL